MQYEFEGNTILTDPTITINRLVRDYHDDITEVDVSIIDANDGISITLSSDVIPASMQEQALMSWALNELKQYEI